MYLDNYDHKVLNVAVDIISKKAGVSKTKARMMMFWAIDDSEFKDFVVNLCKKQNTDDIEFVRDIVKEGALEEAIATVNRKINYRLDKIEHLKQRFQENGPELISKYEEELKELMAKQESFVAEYNSIKIK